MIFQVMALFRVDYTGRGELADRQQRLAQLMSRLQKIAEEYNVAVFITNQMTADPGATMLQVWFCPSWRFHIFHLFFRCVF